MSITDKTRKILWGKSGNRCAICKYLLVVDANSVSDESVIGEECHIISRAPDGPRYDPLYTEDQIDTIENLILLCRVHHKQVDDQRETFTKERLAQVKSEHELWVSRKLSESEPIRIRRIRQNIPKYLERLTSGKQVLGIIANSHAYFMNNEELVTNEEVELAGQFFQVVKDWGEIWNDVEPKDKVSAEFEVARMLMQLDQTGFWVFGAVEVQRLEGGDMGDRNWNVATISITRKTSPSVIPLSGKTTPPS